METYRTIVVSVMEDSSRQCGPGQICPAYTAGKFPEMCGCLKQRSGELQLLQRVCGAMVIAIAVVTMGLIYTWR